MKLVKHASGKRSLVLSRKEWINIGREHGWLNKKAWHAGGPPAGLQGDVTRQPLKDLVKPPNPDFNVQQILDSFTNGVITGADFLTKMDVIRRRYLSGISSNVAKPFDAVMKSIGDIPRFVQQSQEEQVDGMAQKVAAILNVGSGTADDPIIPGGHRVERVKQQIEQGTQPGAPQQSPQQV